MEKDTTLRNILMLKMIPREPHFTTAEILREKLADQGYNLHLRSIQRNLVKCSTRFGITCKQDECGRSNCWYWSRDADISDIPEMSPMTAMTFNLVESFLIRIIPQSILRYISPHFKRASNILGKLEESKWSQWGRKIQIIPRGLQLIPASIDPQIFEGVYDAVLREYQAKISYQKRNKSSSSEYLLNPLGLVFNQEVVYLVATKDKSTLPQQFAMHRIRKVKIEEKKAYLPQRFELKAYIEQGAFQYEVSEELVELKAIFDREIAAHLYESKLTEGQKLTIQSDGRVILEAELFMSSALKWWLLGFGDGVEVLEPRKLREKFRAIVNNLNIKYEASSQSPNCMETKKATQDG